MKGGMLQPTSKLVFSAILVSYFVGRIVFVYLVSTVLYQQNVVYLISKAVKLVFRILPPTMKFWFLPCCNYHSKYAWDNQNHFWGFYKYIFLWSCISFLYNFTQCSHSQKGEKKKSTLSTLMLEYWKGIICTCWGVVRPLVMLKLRILINVSAM